MSPHLSIATILFFYLFLSVSCDNHQIDGNCDPPRTGTCMNIWKCPYYSNLLKRTSIPRPYVIIQHLRKNLCGFVDRNTPEICCNDPLIIDRKTDLNQQNSDVNNHQNLQFLPNDRCGRVSLDTRITGGIRTNPNDFPWMALIAYRKEGDLAEFRCGGSLINNRYILTAAHCIEDSTTILGVRLGEYNILKDVDCDSSGLKCKPPVQDYLIDKITVHPDYDADTLINDIALLRIANTVDFIKGHIEPICLPTTPHLLNYNLDRRNVIVTGWGATAYGDKSAVLLKVVMPIIPIKECKKLYANLKPIGDHQLCAGGNRGKDSCAGDSGGPLQFISNINGTSRLVQYGIVSYGPRYCGMDGRPGIYTKITDYMQWILDNLRID